MLKHAARALAVLHLELTVLANHNLFRVEFNEMFPNARCLSARHYMDQYVLNLSTTHYNIN